MIEQDEGGAIVITSSTAGVRGMYGSPVQRLKHGVVGFMRSLALEVAPHRIRVNTVHPTSVSTPMILNDVFRGSSVPTSRTPPRTRGGVHS